MIAFEGSVKIVKSIEYTIIERLTPSLVNPRFAAMLSDKAFAKRVPHTVSHFLLILLLHLPTYIDWFDQGSIQK